MIIEEISLDRAHFFYNSDSSSEDDEDLGTEEGDPAADDGGNRELKVFELRKVDIRKVVFESKNSDFKVEIDEIFLKGLRIEDDTFALEDLSVGSNFVDLQLEDATAVEIAGVRVPFKRQVRGSIKSIVHPSVLKDIDFTVEMGAMGGDKVTRARLFEEAVEVFNPTGNDEGFMIADHFTAADYFAPKLIALPDDLSITMRHGGAGEESVKVEGGAFAIGKAAFVIAAQLLQEEDAPIVATSNHAGLDITARVRIIEEGVGLRVELDSKPASSPRDLIATLLHGNDYEALDGDARAQVDASVQRFAFTKPGEGQSGQ